MCDICPSEMNDEPRRIVSIFFARCVADAGVGAVRVAEFASTSAKSLHSLLNGRCLGSGKGTFGTSAHLVDASKYAWAHVAREKAELDESAVF